MSEREMRRVLVIDDDELSREVLEVLLADEGFGVEVASSGEDALERFAGEGGPPDVVLMDLHMPGLCGGELATRLRAVCPGGMKIVAMSGSEPGGADLREVDGFLLKPFAVEEFRLKLDGGERGGAGFGGRLEAIAAGASDEVLDERIFAGFEAMVGRGPLRELYGTCLSDAAMQHQAMLAAAAADDDTALRKSAHAIKGSLGMVGARELQRMCSELEETGLRGTYIATLAEFPTALERLRDMLVARGVISRTHY